MAPNPAMLQLNEVVVASCSSDVVRHLGAVETVRLQQPANRLLSLASHLVQQRRCDTARHSVRDASAFVNYVHMAAYELEAAASAGAASMVLPIVLGLKCSMMCLVCTQLRRTAMCILLTAAGLSFDQLHV